MDRLDLLKTYLAESPNDSFLIFAIAKEYEKRKELNEALQQYRLLEEKDPNYVGTYYHLGKLLEAKEDFVAAFNTYKQGMKIAKAQGDQHALSELAGAKLNLGDDEDFE